ncbi:MAG: hypothetical protein EOP48_07520 [Sphingobacteriales bacterium]|nr:MAG: hypothetical protein EOP48_07520 [Sphingobacteriales bacterium]
MIDDSFEKSGVSGSLTSLLSKDWKSYKDEKSKIALQQERLSYNIVSVSSYSGHLENYHSDIWQFLLDPKAGHGKGSLFLEHFLRYLVCIGALEKNDAVLFNDAYVLREKGRIDVCIINSSNSHCIIIENKINNAVDQTKQLERYYNYARKRKLKVCAMLYVSARGDRHAVIEEIIVTAIAACNNTNNDLLNGWILPVEKRILESVYALNKDILSFTHQYVLLLQHLTVLNLTIMNSQTLYKLLNRKEDLDTASLLVNEISNIKLYRHQAFTEKIGTNYFAPFKKQGHYPGYVNHMIFSDWNYQNKYNFQFSIIHRRDSTEFVIYESKGRLSPEETKTFLAKVFDDNPFEFIGTLSDNNQFRHTIGLNAEKDTLEKLDEEVVMKAKEFFAAMKEFNSKSFNI